MKGNVYKEANSGSVAVVVQEQDFRLAGLLVWLVLILLCFILGMLIYWSATETMTVLGADGVYREIHPITYVIN